MFPRRPDPKSCYKRSLLWVVCCASLLTLRPAATHGAGRFNPPPDAFLFLEVNRPVDHFTQVAETLNWDPVEEILACLSSGLSDRNSAQGRLLEGLARLPSRAQFLQQLELLGGVRVSVILRRGGESPEFILVAETDQPGRQMEGLLGVVGELLPNSRFQFITSATGYFSMSEAHPRGLMFAVQREDRCALAASDAAAEEILSKFEEDSDALEASGSSLARTIRDLAPDPWVRGFLATAPLLGYLSEDKTGPGPTLRALQALLSRMSGIAFARSLREDSLDTVMVVQWHPDRLDALTRVGERLRSVEADSTPAPPGTRADFEIGLHLRDDLAAWGVLLNGVFPGVWLGIQSELQAFERFTGLGTERHFLEALEPGFRVLVLGPGETEGVPVPRPVLLVGTGLPGQTRVFLDALFSWFAGALAPLTEGALGAEIEREGSQGDSVTALRLEGVTPGDLPSPAFALIRNVVILSPFRSAVDEVVSHYRGVQLERKAVPAGVYGTIDWRLLADAYRAWREVAVVSDGSCGAGDSWHGFAESVYPLLEQFEFATLALEDGPREGMLQLTMKVPLPKGQKAPAGRSDVPGRNRW